MRTDRLAVVGAVLTLAAIAGLCDVAKRTDRPAETREELVSDRT